MSKLLRITGYCVQKGKKGGSRRPDALHATQRSRIREGAELGLYPIRTLQEVSDLMGISKQRIEQIEGIALWKLKHRMLQEAADGQA